MTIQKSFKERINEKYEEIQKVYFNDDRPWIIGYSGGKDSTTVLQLIYNSLTSLPSEKLHKPVYIISSDTLVENPLILDYVVNNIKRLNDSFGEYSHIFKASIVRPSYNNSFWTLLIGKGYPSPRQKFRWCTDRLKIAPTDQFIKTTIDEFGEAIVVLGVRRQESSSRAGVIDSHSIEGKILKKHTSTNNAYIYAPIEDFSLDDVWNYLQRSRNPWGADNTELLSLYADSQDSAECPMQIDKDAPSCGNSRFGCWVCTVVREDKSLSGFIRNGHSELKPLLDFRLHLQDMRDKPENRMKHRMGGEIYFINTKEGKRRGLGPFNLDARKEILSELLKTELQYNSMSGNEINLITKDELQLIRQHWIASGDIEDSLPKLYENITGVSFNENFDEIPLFNSDEVKVLYDVCNKEEVDPALISQLIELEKEYYGTKSRSNILTKMDRILRQDWLHEDIILDEAGEINDY